MFLNTCSASIAWRADGIGGLVSRRFSRTNAHASQKQSRLASFDHGLINVAGDLHLHVHVQVGSSSSSEVTEKELAATLQSAVLGAVTAAAASTNATDSCTAISPAVSTTPAPEPLLAPFTCIKNLSCPNVTSLAMCSDGHQVVCGLQGPKGSAEFWRQREGGMDIAVLWDVRKPGQGVVPMAGATCSSKRVVLSADGGHVVMGSTGGLQFWDVHLGTVDWLLQWSQSVPLDFRGEARQEGRLKKFKDAAVDSVAITPDGRYAVSGSFTGMLHVWDLQAKECISSVDPGGLVTSVAIDPEGPTVRALVLGPTIGGLLSPHACTRVWHWTPGSDFKAQVTLQDSARLAIQHMSMDGRVVLAADACAGIFMQWNGHSGKLEATFPMPAVCKPGPYDELPRMALSSDGSRVVLGCCCGHVSVWDVKGRACLATLHDTVDSKATGKDAAAHNVNASDRPRLTLVAISSDGRHAASLSTKNDRLFVWHLG